MRTKQWTDFVSLPLGKTNIDAKVNNFDSKFLGRAERFKSPVKTLHSSDQCCSYNVLRLKQKWKKS